MNTDKLISFEKVFYSYDEEDQDRRFVLSDIDLTINKGDFIAILGHNGSGKSTLAKLSNSIFLPTEGKVYVDGMDTSDPENEFAVRKKVGVVMQNPDNQIVASIVEEDVAFGPENLGIAPDEIRCRVDSALKAVDMYDYRLHETHKLSGGQKQRVAIAGIIAMQPECIVLDEPTAMLDPKGRREVMTTVKKLNRDYGMAVVFITHFMNEAAEADRIVIINEGRVAADGNPDTVFSDKELLERCGLAVPLIAEIAEGIRKNGIALPEGIYTENDFIRSYLSLVNS